MTSEQILNLKKTDSRILRGLVASTNALQLSTILSCVTLPTVLLNGALAALKLFLIKKF
jgi:hypothetical protein